MKILHLKRNLDYGGAETLLMGYIPLLNDFEHIVVTLNGPNVYHRENYEYIQLDLSYKKDFFKTVRKIKQTHKGKEYRDSSFTWLLDKYYFEVCYT